MAFEYPRNLDSIDHNKIKYQKLRAPRDFPGVETISSRPKIIANSPDLRHFRDQSKLLLKEIKYPVRSGRVVPRNMKPNSNEILLCFERTLNLRHRPFSLRNDGEPLS